MNTNITLINDFNAYRRYALSIPNLSDTEEYNLTVAKDSGDMNAAQKLILSQLKTVIYVAKKYVNYGIAVEELVQEGNIGLMKAVKRFKASRGVRLFTYAIIWIKSEIQSYILNNWKIVKIGTTKNLKKLFFNYRKNNNELLSLGVDKKDLENEICKKLDVRKEDVKAIETFFQHDADEEDLLLLSDEKYTPEESLLKNEEQTQLTKIRNYIDNLPENQRKIMMYKYFNSDSKRTNKEIGEELGISAERVRQIESSILLKIKKSL